MILILGHGVSSKGVVRMAEYMRIPYENLEVSEVTKWHYLYIVKSPGIFPSERILIEAKKRRIPILSDVEFAYQCFKKNYIMISGTNGKTTTSTLIGLFLNRVVCGNVGYSICEAVLNHITEDVFVCELSSFQLDNIKTFKPYVGGITNLGEAHLDYHGSVEKYHDAKLKPIYNQDSNDTFIYNLDDDHIPRIGKGKILSYSYYRKADCYYQNGKIYFKKERVVKTKNIRLKGQYNMYNVMLAICVAKVFKVKNKHIRKVLKEFRGISFRNEKIKKNVYNDAKATNPSATLEALRQQEKCVLICGGYPRCENLQILDSEVYKIRKAYCYGQGRKIIEKYMKEKRIEVECFQTLKEAVYKARKDKHRVPILFSPIMASYDQYNNYIERGEEFNRLIKKGFIKP